MVRVVFVDAGCQMVTVTVSSVDGAGSLSAALLNVGEAEKAADPAAKQLPPGEAAGTCGCNKTCNCTKAAVVFSDLYSTGTPAPGRLFTLRLTDGLRSRR